MKTFQFFDIVKSSVEREIRVISDTEHCLGYGVTTRAVAACVELIEGWVAGGADSAGGAAPAGGVEAVGDVEAEEVAMGSAAPRWLACANPHSLEVARTDAAFTAALHAADLLVPDGVGMVLASRILGGRIRARVTGSDIFLGVNTELSARGGTSCFFLGSTDENLAAIREKMAADFPGVRVAGVHSPPFRDEFTIADDDAMVAAVNAAAPDVLWVGMTAPKQEKWIHRNLGRLETVRFAAAVGAVFDFYTGRVRRSHPVFRRVGLEWLPRLAREPRRLWRRNFVSNPAFLMRVVLERMRRDSPPRR